MNPSIRDREHTDWVWVDAAGGYVPVRFADEPLDWRGHPRGLAEATVRGLFCG